MIVLVTGSGGFIGRHVVDALRRADHSVLEIDVQNSGDDLRAALAEAEAVFHLAGVNRPLEVSEFEEGNAGLTQSICSILRETGRNPLIVMSSSIQAALDNPYGKSKLHAEQALRSYSADVNAPVAIYRLKNVFGKWCRPNYNSVTATFCHNIAHDLPISISNPEKKLELVYIDEVVCALVSTLDNPPDNGLCEFREVPVSFETTLGNLAELIQSFKASRKTLVLPDLADGFVKRLYSTYLSYLPEDDFSYPLDQKTDNRGSLAEFVKAKGAGQIFVSRTKPGITRGHHYHDTKTEKFLVVEGEAVIRFRHIHSDEVLEYKVSGKDFTPVDIIPGYTHSITNIGQGELVTLFWASELFDPDNPDTYWEEVTRG